MLPRKPLDSNISLRNADVEPEIHESEDRHATKQQWKDVWNHIKLVAESVFINR